MRPRRRCRVCGRWFYPHPRAVKKQRVCSRDECQQERHRRNCEDWHRQNADYDRERRLRKKLVVEQAPIRGPAGVLGVDPLRQIDWQHARDLVGLEHTVFVEESCKVLEQWARDAVSAKPHVISKEIPKVPKSEARDDIASVGPSP